MAQPFHIARLKIERAKQHIDDLNLQLRTFIENYSYKFIVNHDPQAGYDLIHLVASDSIPDAISLIVGDAVHNLRTALDYAMHDAVFIPDGFTKFPVYDTRDGLENAIKGGLKNKASEQTIKVIVDTIQPYKGGNGESIWALHTLDIIDKHKLLLAHMDFSYIVGIRAIDGRGEEFEIPRWFFTPPHIMTHRCVGHSDVKITDHGKAVMAVTFDDGLPYEGQFILRALTKFVEVVSEVVKILEVAFFAH